MKISPGCLYFYFADTGQIIKGPTKAAKVRDQLIQEKMQQKQHQITANGDDPRDDLKHNNLQYTYIFILLITRISEF